MNRRMLLALFLVPCLSCAAPAAPRAPVVQPPPTPKPAPTAVTAPDAGAAPDRVHELDAKIDAIFSAQAKPDVPGCAVGVYHTGEIVFARGYGLANLEHSVPLTADSVFDVASISKQFTALAILLLVQDGKLSLDDDIRKYVPEMPDYGRPIRLHHLLHHTSGVREYQGLLGLAGLGRDVVTDDDLLSLLHQQRALNFAPGTNWEYSNMGYFLLSVVVKRVSGMKFSAFAKERIFDPLGMNRTSVLDDHTAIVPGRATGYVVRPGGGSLRTELSRWEHPGASRVFTTVNDLARWDANFYEPRVGDRATIEMLRTPGKLDDGKPLTYALGLFEQTIRGRRVESHTGSTGGYISNLIRFPAERLTVACLCNVEGDDKTAPWDSAPEVADLFLPPTTAAPPAAPAGTTDAGADAASSKPTYEPTAAELAELVGAYYDPETFMLRTITVDRGHILVGIALHGGGAPRVVQSLGPRTFGLPDQDARFTFEPASRSAPARLVRKVGDERSATLLRLEPAVPNAATFAAYAGRYRSEESPRDLQILVKDGALRAAIWGHPSDSQPLEPLGRDVFKTEDGGVRFERDAQGGVRGFVIAGDGYHGIRFTRLAAP